MPGWNEPLAVDRQKMKKEKERARVRFTSGYTIYIHGSREGKGSSKQRARDSNFPLSNFPHFSVNKYGKGSRESFKII
jgi:hypothetical protein